MLDLRKSFLADWVGHITLLLASVFFVYGHTLAFPFVFDDGTIFERTSLRYLWPLSHFLSEGISRSFVNFTFALNIYFSGESASAFRFTNLVIHFANGTLLYALIIRLSRRAEAPWACDTRTLSSFAFGISAIWICHPLNTQAVTYIVQRYEIAMAMFVLLYLHAYLVVLETRSITIQVLSVISAIVFLALGIASKEVAVAAIPLGLLMDFSLSRQPFLVFLRRRVTLLIALVCCGVILAPRVLVMMKGDGVSAGLSLKEVGPMRYLVTQPEVILHYFKLCVWPNPQYFDYGWPFQSDIRLALLAVIANIFVALAILIYCRFNRIAITAICAWYVVLAPTSSFIPLLDAAVEHRLYLPSMIVVFGVAYILWTQCERYSRKGLVGWLMISIAGICGVMSWLRNDTYSSTVRLWSDVYTAILRGELHHLYADRVANNLGSALVLAGDYELAETVFRDGLVRSPKDLVLRENLGRVLLFQEKLEAAEEILKAFDEEACKDPSAICLAGYVAARLGDYERAKERVRRAWDSKDRDKMDDLFIANTCYLTHDLVIGENVFPVLLSKGDPKPVLCMRWIELLCANGRTAEARKWIDTLGSLGGTASEKYLAEAICLVAEEGFGAAIELIDRELSEKAIPNAWLTKGYALERLGNRDAALAAFREELLRDSDSFEAMCGVARLESDNNPKVAMEYISLALKERPRDRKVAVDYATILAKVESAEVAIRWIERYKGLVGESSHFDDIVAMLRALAVSEREK